MTTFVRHVLSPDQAGETLEQDAIVLSTNVRLGSGLKGREDHQEVREAHPKKTEQSNWLKNQEQKALTTHLADQGTMKKKRIWYGKDQDTNIRDTLSLMKKGETTKA